MLQHECMSHGCCGKSFTCEPIDQVDPLRTGPCWCHDNRLASRTLASWSNDVERGKRDKNHELLAGSHISQTQITVSQRGAQDACPAPEIDSPSAVSDEGRSTNNTHLRFHPSYLHDGVTADDLALREEPFIHMLRYFCALPADKIYDIYAKPPLRSCFPASNNAKASLSPKARKKTSINDTSGYGYAARYPTLNKQAPRLVPTSR